MEDGRDEKADGVIKRHMAYAMAGGAVPVPILDLAAVTAVQLDMLRQLAGVYGTAFDGGSARAFVTSVGSALMGNLAARVGASMLKLLPGVGTIGGGVAQAVLTGASTYAVGNLFKRLFREGRAFQDLDAVAVREEAARYFEDGKALARKLGDKLRGSVS